MEDLIKHKEDFERIINKYSLKEESRAMKIANYLTENGRDGIDLDDFSKTFEIEKNDARVLISFIVKGIKFKEDYIDKK